MTIFNTYTVYDKAGNLLASGRSSRGGSAPSPRTYFDSLPADIRQRADVLLVLQERGFVARYRVRQPTVPAPTLDSRENLGS